MKRRILHAPGRWKEIEVEDRSRPCRHLGPEQGSITPQVFACATHGRATLATPAVACSCCAHCPDYTPPEDVPEAGQVRHLLFHVYPLHKGERWRWHAEQMGQRRHLFNGRKRVALAFDEHTDDPAAVRAAFAWADEIVEVANEPDRREMTSFEALFAPMADLAGPEHAVLWAHAKGVVRHARQSVLHWTEALVETLLDHWPAVQRTLRSHPLAGSFRRDIQGWPWVESSSQWHYSGSWFWFRPRDLFSRPGWRRADQFWGAIESYPSLHFSREQAGVIFHSWDQADRPNGQSLYEPAYWASVVTPALERWRREHASDRTPLELLLPTAPEGLRVELGGGETPRGRSWINVDLLPCADVRLDLETDALPFADASVGSLYTSHTLEHVRNLRHVLREIARVCKVGARVEIRVPHWGHSMALCYTHVHTIAEEQVEHWCRTAVPFWFGGSPRRLRHLHTERIPSGRFARARQLHPGWTDEDILAFVPDTCHELRFHLTVVENDSF